MVLMKKNISFLCFVVFILGAVSGCGVVGPLVVATTGAVLSDERSIGAMIDDKILLRKVKAAYSSSGIEDLKTHVKILVVEGRVLLVGNVAKESYAEDAVRLAWEVRGVKDVMNEIQCDKRTVLEEASDIWIVGQINSKLTVERNILSTNYKVAANKGVVYLLGIAQNQEELEHVLRVLSTVNGVKKIVNYVILKDDPKRF